METKGPQGSCSVALCSLFLNRASQWVLVLAPGRAGSDSAGTTCRQNPARNDPARGPESAGEAPILKTRSKGPLGSCHKFVWPFVAYL